MKSRKENADFATCKSKVSEDLKAPVAAKFKTKYNKTTQKNLTARLRDLRTLRMQV